MKKSFTKLESYVQKSLDTESRVNLSWEKEAKQLGWLGTIHV